MFLSLAAEGSGSRGMYIGWGLSREGIREALEELCYCRQFQVTLCSKITGTAFKHLAMSREGSSIPNARGAGGDSAELLLARSGVGQRPRLMMH